MKDMTLGTKLALGFGALITIVIGLSSVSWLLLSTSNDSFNRYRQIARTSNFISLVQENLLKARMAGKNFLIQGDPEIRSEFESYYKAMQVNIDKSLEITTGSSQKAKLEEISSKMSEYLSSFGIVVEQMDIRNEMVFDNLNVHGPKMRKALGDIMDSAYADGDPLAAYEAGRAQTTLMLARLYVIRYLDTNSAEDIARVKSEVRELEARLNTLDSELQNPARRELLENILERKAIYVSAFDTLTEAITYRNSIVQGKLDTIGPELTNYILDLKKEMHAEQDELGPAAVARNERAITQILLTALCASILGIVIAYFTFKSVRNKLMSISSQLQIGSNSLSSASIQISSASMQLSEDSSAQAASLEETCSSLEEMNSVVKSNSDNAERTKELAGSARDAANDGLKLMTDLNSGVSRIQTSTDELVQNMDELQESSNSVSKVIKTIEDIAFQTNILALNAAVEAARAGDAGMGFAVVADEVRSLAHRSADAAKETASLIESSIEKSNEGAESTHRVQENLKEMISQSEQVSTRLESIVAEILNLDSAVNEISAASVEQSTGIDQINTAATAMSDLTQQAAASAEETASSSQELSSQAEILDGLVAELKAMITKERSAQSAKSSLEMPMPPSQQKSLGTAA